MSERIIAEAIFDRLASLDAALEAMPAAGGRGRMGFQALYDYALGGATVDADAVESAVAADARLRADLQRLLDKAALVRLPRLAAAATATTITSREAEGVRFHLRGSRGDPDSVFVVLDCGAAPAPPRAVFILDRDGKCHRFMLPDMQEDSIQVLVPVDSDLVKGLRDKESRIYLS